MFLTAVKDGVVKSLRTALMLLKIMIPIYIGVSLLRHTGLFMWLSERIEPAMRIFGLPGEAVVPLVTGAFADEYATVAAMSGFPFNMAECTIITMMVLCFHGVPLETVISRKIGMPAFRIVVFRLGLALFTGIVIAYLAAVFLGGRMPFTAVERGAIGIPHGQAGPVTEAGGGIFNAGWDVMLPEIGLGAIKTVLTLFRVLIPLMIGIELMLVYRVIEAMAKKLGFFCKLLGIGRDALLPLLIGLFLGVTFGAGALMEMNRTRPLPPRDMTLLGVFLFSCHGLIEGTYLFAVNGANAIFISVVRLAIAIGVTFAAARLLNLRSTGRKSHRNYD